METEKMKEAFEATTQIPNDAEYNKRFCVYRYALHPGVDHPVNELWEAFCDGWKAAINGSAHTDRWRIVPKEPTPEMLNAAREGIYTRTTVRKGMTIRQITFAAEGWTAMLEAAPQPETT